MKAALLAALSSPYLPTHLLSLLKQENLDHDSLDNLVEFILQDSKAASELATYQKELARALLLEPLTFDPKQIQALARLLPNEHIIKLIFELMPSEPEGIEEEEQRIIHNNAEELIAILVVRATRQEDYQRLISEKPKLANLLMRKRLETLTTPKAQQSLISELLDHYPSYDWQDEPFSALVQSSLLRVFLKLPEKEFPNYFKRYYKQFGQEHAAEITQLIGELLQSSIPTTWILSCINQDIPMQQNPNLITFFLKIPNLTQEFLDNTLKTIRNNDLLNLTLFLVDLNEKQQSIPGVLDKVLDSFCLRLLNAAELDKDPIHDWQTKKEAPRLALYLATRPSCLQSLSTFATFVQTYTPTVLQVLQSYVTRSSPASDLKNRSIAVIESLDCDAEKFKEIALAVLFNYRQTPQTLQVLFSNLELANTYLSKPGQNNHPRFHDNYLRLKKACWELLIRDLPYDEKAATQLLTTQLITAHSFDWLLISLINQQKSDNNPVYLSELDSKSLSFLAPEILAAVLLQSNSKETTSNWPKVDSFLNKNCFEDQLAFAKALIQQLLLQKKVTARTSSRASEGATDCLGDSSLARDDVHAVNVERGFKLMTNLSSFAGLIVEFNTSEIQWLVANSPEPYLKEHFPTWLNSLLNKQELDATSLNELFNLLPADPDFLSTLFTQEKLTPYLPQLLLQFATKEAYAPHLVALYQQVDALSQAEKQEFITTVQQSLLSRLETNKALPVLTTLLLSLKTLSIHDPKARELIRNQLRLFNHVVNHTDFDQSQSPELQQSLFNLLNFLNMQDPRWVEEIFNDANFASLAPLWLKNIDPTKQNYHLFTQVLLDHTTAKIHPTLLAHPDYQQYLQQLLSNPPESMTDDRFNLLFKHQLSPSNQKLLAQKLLQKSTVDQLNDASLLTLTRALNIKELYEVAVGKELSMPGIFVKLLALHPDGLNQLSEPERNILLSNLKDRQQLLHILNSQTSPKCKTNFVNYVFEYLLQNKIVISTWLEKLHVDGPSFAALANYTTNLSYQQLIKDRLASTTGLSSLREDIKDYLQNPTLNSPIEPNGLLYWLIQDTFLNPQTGWRCHPSLLATIKDSGAAHQIILRNQFLFLGQVLKLQDFYTPFSSCNNDGQAPLAAARWLHQLPLISQGLLQIVQDLSKLTYPLKQKNAEEKRLITLAICQKTRLYTQLIQPMLSGEYMDGTCVDNAQLRTIQINELYDLLIEYSAAIKPYDPQYSDYLDSVIQRYTIKLQAIEHTSFPGAHDLFHPGSQLSQIKHHASRPNWDKSSQLLDQASLLHSQHMTKTLSPSDYLTSLIKLFIENPKWLKGSGEFQNWLFACLTSPLTATMPPALLAKLFSHYPTHSLIELLNANQKKLDRFESNFKMLAQLNTIKSLEEMLEFLLSADLLPLLEACEFADLPYLSNLIHFALQVQETGLPYPQMMTRLLSSQLTKNFELHWLKIDLDRLVETKENLVARQNTLILAAFRYRTSATNQPSVNQPLTQLDQLTSIKSNPKTLIACLYSYLPIFKTKNTVLMNQFLTTIINLLHLYSKPEILISQLPPDLLDQILSTALKAPEKYKLFIVQLMSASDITRHRELIQTQLTALINQYALIGEYMLVDPYEVHTLADLGAEEIANVSPNDFKRILFLQRLLLQISPPLDLASWVNDAPMTDRKIRAYFAADAGLYEQIINLPELTNAANLDEKTVSNYQTNLENAYGFITHNNHASIYGGLAEQFNQATTPIAPVVLYHYLNIASMVSNDKHITAQDRLDLSKLLGLTNLPLDTLNRLHTNCPSKVIYPIYNAHLLSRPDFYATLPGKSMLDELKPDYHQRIKKRLHSFVQAIDLTLVHDETLQLLAPEAAATLFCSAPHFHQLNTKNIPILLERVGAQRNLLLNYWINAYSAMPNYEGALLRLASLYPNEVTAAIGKMPLSQRQQIVSALLVQLGQPEEQEQICKESQLTALSEIINDYLHECEKDTCPEQERLGLQTMTHQLICGQINSPNQQILLNQFWKNLKQSNGRIIAYSLQRDTKKFIHALSSQKKPEQLLELFDAALLQFNGSKKTKEIIERARSEAAVEDRLSKLSFLKTFRSWLKRCSFYGWTGFFTPKQPTYLVSLTKPLQKNTSVVTQTNFEQLTTLLNTMTHESVAQDIPPLLFKVVDAYEQEPKNRDEEIILRIKIEELFKQKLAKSLSDSWLPNHLSTLITNRKKLIALYCASGQKEALLSLLATAKQGPGHFDDIIDEFLGCQFPIVEAAIELSQTIKTYATNLPDLTTIPKNLGAIAGQLRRMPDLLRAMPDQLREIPAQLLALPDQLSTIPRRLLAVPRDLVSYVGHFNLFARTPANAVAQERGAERQHAQNQNPPVTDSATTMPANA